MIQRLINRLKFVLERWIQRGPLYQLLMMAALIGLVALMGGFMGWTLTDDFESLGAAIWWGFLRLTDPGYLGDDQGIALRAISTGITVLGYVIFMGSLVAILTQGLNNAMRQLESGLTPISLDGHILILGWTNRTPAIINELMLSEGRVKRFLRNRRTRNLTIVVLAEEVNLSMRQDLNDRSHALLRKGSLILRTGSSMQIEHLRRVDFNNAAAIIIPGADFAMGGSDATDARIIKTLMLISKYRSTHQPAVVTEFFDNQKTSIAHQAYSGHLHVIPSNSFISRLIAQTVRHEGLSYVYNELLSYSAGNEVYIRSCPQYAGRPLSALALAFPKAILLGLVRPSGTGFMPYLNAPNDMRLEADDRLVFIARSYEECQPSPVHPFPETATETVEPLTSRVLESRRILILGWSSKIEALIHEFDGYPDEKFEIDIMSRTAAESREQELAGGHWNPERISVRHFVADYTSRHDIMGINPEAYNNIIFLGSDWLENEHEADARTILGYVLLRSLLPSDSGPERLLELIDPSNAQLFQTRTGEVIISPIVLSHMLAHVTLRQELNCVFEEIFGAQGAEITFQPVSLYGIEGVTTSFREVQNLTRKRHAIALGVRLKKMRDKRDGGVYLNPPQDNSWTFEKDDSIIVLTGPARSQDIQR